MTECDGWRRLSSDATASEPTLPRGRDGTLIVAFGPETDLPTSPHEGVQ